MYASVHIPAAPAGVSAACLVEADLVVRESGRQGRPLAAREATVNEAADLCLQVVVIAPEDAFPDAHSPIVAGSGERSSVRTEGDTVDRPLITCERLAELGGCGCPRAILDRTRRRRRASAPSGLKATSQTPPCPWSLFTRVATLLGVRVSRSSTVPSEPAAEASVRPSGLKATPQTPWPPFRRLAILSGVRTSHRSTDLPAAAATVCPSGLNATLGA